MRARLSRYAVLPLLLACAVPALAAKAPDTWDGLMHVKSSKIETVYLQPDADFRGYTKVMIDPAEIAFRKNWQREHGFAEDRGRPVSNEQARDILEQAKTGFHKLFVEAYQKAGYQVVDQPGSDVLRLSTAVVNLDVVAPDPMTAGRSWTFSRDAGGGTLVIEARDSRTGALLGRAVDSRSMEDSRAYLRNTVTNTADFEDLFAHWAKLSAAGLTELKSLSPINAEGMSKK
ncbi:uncharacterized protein DUF3313 [Novosphingobium sp. PhB57]|jgi:hypothetical protein|uniref:DUF3313 family protein n=1 Tax=unclassified Novosphingobium TaxID=2644732 RepID=UPI00104FB1AD|nr:MULTISPECIES: DUF3313 family protein [unclassified Novosphingobium]TCU61910.1 uncharacterized protein DUF3313 [Novosphingobium sp. PhB57]TDW68978.1 uncharacterized protein DUF3313 [Novosphingobium sp. PhB55]